MVHNLENCVHVLLRARGPVLLSIRNTGDSDVRRLVGVLPVWATRTAFVTSVLSMSEDSGVPNHEAIPASP